MPVALKVGLATATAEVAPRGIVPAFELTAVDAYGRDTWRPNLLTGKVVVSRPPGAGPLMVLEGAEALFTVAKAVAPVVSLRVSTLPSTRHTLWFNVSSNAAGVDGASMEVVVRGCPGGQGVSADKLGCSACIPGSASPSGVCRPCAPGHYMEEQGAWGLVVVAVASPACTRTACLHPHARVHAQPAPHPSSCLTHDHDPPPPPTPRLRACVHVHRRIALHQVRCGHVQRAERVLGQGCVPQLPRQHALAGWFRAPR